MGFKPRMRPTPAIPPVDRPVPADGHLGKAIGVLRQLADPRQLGLSPRAVAGGIKTALRHIELAQTTGPAHDVRVALDLFDAIDAEVTWQPHVLPHVKRLTAMSRRYALGFEPTEKGPNMATDQYIRDYRVHPDGEGGWAITHDRPGYRDRLIAIGMRRTDAVQIATLLAADDDRRR